MVESLREKFSILEYPTNKNGFRTPKLAVELMHYLI